MDPMGLVVGDVLLKRYYGGAVHFFIHNLTRNEQGSSKFVHAAMYIGNGEIAESSGGGYRIAKLMNQGKHFNYFVFRYRDRNMAEIAAQVIATWVKMRPTSKQHIPEYSGGKKFGEYALGTAVSSALRNWVDRNLKPEEEEGARLWGANGRPGQSASFCSQYVVQAYLAAGATYAPPTEPIRLAAKRATPGLLHDSMLHDERWQFIGSFTST